MSCTMREALGYWEKKVYLSSFWHVLSCQTRENETRVGRIIVYGDIVPKSWK